MSGLQDRARRGDVGAMRAIAEQLIAEHRITVTWGVPSRDAYAQIARRHIGVPHIVDFQTFAAVIHEIGHIVNGPCPRTGAHRRVKGIGCLACEDLGWEFMGRALPGFPRALFEQQRYALGTYRWMPATAAAQRHADRLIGSVAWATNFHTWKKWESRLERQEAANAGVARDRAKRAAFEQREQQIRLWRQECAR